MSSHESDVPTAIASQVPRTYDTKVGRTARNETTKATVDYRLSTISRADAPLHSARRLDDGRAQVVVARAAPVGVAGAADLAGGAVLPETSRQRHGRLLPFRSKRSFVRMSEVCDRKTRALA